MPKFSEISKCRLESCDHKLQDLFNEVVKTWDCTIVCGHRGKSKQDRAYNLRKSKKKYPNSEHNSSPSRAADVAPYPIDWDDLGGFYMFAGYVLRVASEMGIKIRYGGDWDGDKKTADQTFNDLAHFELL